MTSTKSTLYVPDLIYILHNVVRKYGEHPMYVSVQQYKDRRMLFQINIILPLPILYN